MSEKDPIELAIPDYKDKFGENPTDNLKAEFRYENYQRRRRAVELYLKGAEPDVIVKEGEYTALFIDGGKLLYLKEEDPYPVPAGTWQGFWDSDLEEVLGITKEMYNKMSFQEKMNADARVQAIKYAPKYFEKLKNEFWFLESKQKPYRRSTIMRNRKKDSIELAIDKVLKENGELTEMEVKWRELLALRNIIEDFSTGDIEALPESIINDLGNLTREEAKNIARGITFALHNLN